MIDPGYRWTRQKECGSKVRYLNEQTARRNCPSSQKPYQCRFCGFYHTGHKKDLTHAKQSGNLEIGRSGTNETSS